MCRLSPSHRPRSFRHASSELISRDLSAPFHLRSSVTRTSGVAASLGLSADSSVCLAARRGEGREMRPTDVCFPTHSLRAPAPRAFPARVVSRRRERLQEARPGKMAFHDAMYRFGGLDDLRWRGVLFPVTAHRTSASGTPVAPLAPPGCAFTRVTRASWEGAETASAVVLVKGERHLRSGVPSIGG
jgi:hypothetical protein